MTKHDNSNLRRTTFEKFMELRKEFLNTEYMEKNLSMIQYDTTML
jgi:hypothetical protein